MAFLVLHCCATSALPTTPYDVALEDEFTTAFQAEIRAYEDRYNANQAAARQQLP
jgi:hypothetical protein